MEDVKTKQSGDNQRCFTPGSSCLFNSYNLLQGAMNCPTCGTTPQSKLFVISVKSGIVAAIFTVATFVLALVVYVHGPYEHAKTPPPPKPKPIRPAGVQKIKVTGPKSSGTPPSPAKPPANNISQNCNETTGLSETKPNAAPRILHQHTAAECRVFALQASYSKFSAIMDPDRIVHPALAESVHHPEIPKDCNIF
ncbi:MAG: hypothetical protein ABR906_10890 [Terracidiphilus sp.]|jgi:hypothetical protein